MKATKISSMILLCLSLATACLWGVIAIMTASSASATGTLPISYTWEFDDKTSKTGPEVIHSFSSPGSHSVELAVENGCGAPVNVEADVLITQRSWLPITKR